jgi:hypothetical protein
MYLFANSAPVGRPFLKAGVDSEEVDSANKG